MAEAEKRDNIEEKCESGEEEHELSSCQTSMGPVFESPEQM